MEFTYLNVIISIKSHLFTGNQRASSLSRLGDNGFPTSTANIPMATSSQAPEYAEIPEGIFQYLYFLSLPRKQKFLDSALV